MNPQPFEIDPDITKAWTPRSEIYTSPQVYALAKERVLARSWQLAGDAGSVRVPGQVHPVTLLEGCLDEPLLLTRDANDNVHCISNVCTHRGALVCETPGIERTLRCRYHGRRFALDGRFQSMPEFAGVQNFPSPADDLARVSLERWGPLLFASLKPAATFDAVIGPMLKRLEWLPLREFKFDATRSRDYLVQCNWALYCENYLEGFHIPYVHASLAEAIDFSTYRTERFEWCSLQLALSKGGEHAFDPPTGAADHGLRVAAYYWWVFPNMMFNVYPWGLSINIVKPLGVDRSRVSFLAYVWDPLKLDVGAGTELDRVEREDESVVEAVQRGVRSRLYERGRYSPKHETGTHHFHRLLARELGALSE